jgi:hypothetical protein
VWCGSVLVHGTAAGVTTIVLARRAGQRCFSLALRQTRTVACARGVRAMSGGPLADDGPEAGFDYDLIVIGGGSGGTHT